MKLFDKVFGTKTVRSQEPLTPAEAYAAITLAAIASDGYLGNGELDGLVMALSRMQLFKSYPSEVMHRMFTKLFTILRREGLETLFNLAKDSLPFELHQSAFALATDLILSDGAATEHEQDFLNQLYQALEIPDGIAVKIVEVMLIKNRG